MEDTILDVEYYINKVAFALQSEMDIESIRLLLIEDNLSEEECYLIIKAGMILVGYWVTSEIDEEPTKRDYKSIRPQKL